MKVSESDTKLLRAMEENFLKPEFRSNPVAAADVFAEEFIEVGKSGRSFTKAEIIADLRGDSFIGERSISEFKTRSLAQGLVLVRYLITARDRDTEKTSQSVRCSIWQQREGRWQIVFHQGTPRAL